MERVTAAGYRDDWRGAVAYLCSPEWWRTGPYVAFLVLVGAFLAAAAARSASGAAPVINVAVTALVGWWLVVRPLRGVVRRHRARPSELR